MTATIVPVLHADRIYLAHDRFVCASACCAGSTALYTGRTIGGAKLRPVDTRDIAEWAGYGLGALTCECGRLTVEAAR